MIFHLNSLSETIHFFHQEKKKKNPSYSLRAFARDLGTSVSHLSQVINGKKKFSTDKIINIEKTMKLKEEESYFLKLLNDLENASGKKQTGSILEEIEKIRHRFKVQVQEADQFKSISDWHHVAILELTCMKTKGVTLKEMCNLIFADESLIKPACERLLRLKLIKKKGSYYSRTSTNLAFRSEKKDKAYENFNNQISDFGKKANFKASYSQKSNFYSNFFNGRIFVT